MARCIHALMACLLLTLFFTLIPTVKSADYPIRKNGEPYHSKEDAIQMYKDLCDTYPEYTSYEVIGQSYLGKDIYLFKVGNPEGGRVMIDGSTHGPEDAGTEFSYLFIKWILEKGIDNVEEDAYKVLHGNYFLAIPIVNMDSYRRQNARTYYTASESPTGQRIDCPYGVDLNRNGVTGWGSSGSGNPLDDYSYRGAWAGSEPETQAYRYAMDKYRPEIYVNTHFGGAEYLQNKDSAQTPGMRDKVLAAYDEIRAEYGVSYRYTIRSGLSGGFVANDGWGYGASGWLVEFIEWDKLPADYDTFVEVCYPQAFTIYLAWCEAVQIDVTYPPAYMHACIRCSGNIA